MTDSATEQQLVTRLLKEWSSGNKEALDEPMPVVYQRLRKLVSICVQNVPIIHCELLRCSMRLTCGSWVRM
jgi:hypothetical protein